jgi:hypothetical protein
MPHDQSDHQPNSGSDRRPGDSDQPDGLNQRYTFDPDHASAGSRETVPVPVPVPLSVWACAQRPAVWQRRGRYLPATTSHPAKMLPTLAATAITSYTRSGELVLDPMCGVGTTGRSRPPGPHRDRDRVRTAVGNLARANLDLAREDGAVGRGAVITGDARNAGALITDPHIVGKVALLLTSPPYGQATHGQVRSSHETGRAGVRKYDYGYGTSPRNLARGSHDRLLSGFTDILAGCLPLLRPGGIVAITTRPFRRHGHLIDFPAEVWAAAQDAGLEPLQRLVALLCGIKDDHLVTRASFFAMHETRKARAAGLPLHVNAHEEVLILRRRPLSSDSGEPIDPQPAPQRPEDSPAPVDRQVFGDSRGRSS